MDICDVAVVGGGPAGMMAAIRAGGLKKEAWLLERGDSLGRKLLLSGKERCNVTNMAPLDDFMAKFGRQGDFLRTAFSRFFNQDLIDFFKVKGLELKVERQGRVFPVTDRASSVLDALKDYLRENKVQILYNTRVSAIKKEGDIFSLNSSDAGTRKLSARKVILAAGGASFSWTGSSGDGFAMAGKLGHTITPLKAGLVPLKTKESWVKELRGLSLKNIRLSFKSKDKKIVSNIGELLFTHFGVSGPLVLDLSGSALRLRDQSEELFLYIDLKPGLSPEQIEERLLREFRLQGSKGIKNILKELLPLKLIEVFLNLCGLDPGKKGSQINKEEKSAIARLLKSLPLEISGPLPIEEAMVTCAGVPIKEINPRTMESRLVAGLYFAGEIIDASAASGGYNLQQAFSTGYLAGESAVKSLGI
ncbi:MAG: hypothetical protein A2321_02770 [Omnitrophica WOR_2 bacterium RIFOXYB2_FULL_45_11]|nr:MAG: hypothetical protein A2321_02770 [Omnitrophica WOR_2 bacterium RIFOXYB2_FULL_45_11]OGX61146.1 MAG: hypothetical protein A2471_05680 [Omnitrophica WOR_2 bacterium RIFOXYC2_FULL_45_15]